MEKKVSIIGLGRVGLPTALILRQSGHDVIGIDSDLNTLEKIRTHAHLIDEPGIQELLKKFPFPTYCKPQPADIHLIAVPTPLTGEKHADLSFLNAAIDSLLPIIKKGDLIIIESTSPIGTTKSLSDRIPQALFAYCPERVLPGFLLTELVHNDRVIGGTSPEATKRASAFYRAFIKGDLWETDAPTAEAVKLAENTYRDVNIAFANELSMIADNCRLSINEVIRLANFHPRVNILNPGPGVGGHCISVDPYFLIEAAPRQTSIISSARQVNEKKKEWVLEKIKKTAAETGSTSIACLGLTYKANVQDFRNSPSLEIAKQLAKEFSVAFIDPFLETNTPPAKEIAKSDMVVVFVAHDAFEALPASLLKEKPLLDFAGAF